MSIRETFKSVFDSDYCGAGEFISRVLVPIFGENEVNDFKYAESNPTQADEETLRKANIQEIYRVATINRVGTDPIEVFDVTMGDSTDLSRSRVGIQRIIRSALFPYSHAFIVFHYKNLGFTEWRFSYVYKQDKNANTTDAKRYTYLFSRELHARTAIDRFCTLAESKKDNEALLEAFNVEALSDDFFEEYRTQYAKFVKYITGKEYVKEGGKYVEQATGKPNEELYSAFGKDDKTIRDYVKKMMGRITFLHFLQRKRWMNGDVNYLLKLFKESKYKNNYLDKVLEPLFFGILNTKPENRAALFRKEGWDMELLAEWKSIPYLNGGLFEQEEVDKYKSVFPAEFFESLFTFFSEYNFTVDENDPDDAEVGVDPEMLGKIFENLLEDNKDKGAFYTPKEIVRYMCRESLIAYLVEKTGITEPVLREFVSDPYEKAEDMEWGDKEVVLNALECVKICDPAIGSGAFPMGLLNELVRCEEAIVLGQEKNTGRAELKKSIIKNNIYGVDIEKGAVDIARLRFWLSIVVDEDAPSPLPNLDYKIMQGDSLLEWYEGVDLSHLTDSDGMDLMMNSECAEVHKNKLAQLLKEYFDESDHGKKYELKGLIKDTITDILDIAGISIPKEIDIAENKHFFLWHTWYNEVFSNNGGFDICLGNPPYVLINKDLYKEKYEHGFKHQEGKIDLYRLFIEFSIGLLNNSGCLSFITPNTFLSIKNCYLLRKFIIENTSLVSVVNYDGSVFEDASVNSIVFLLTKCSTQKETIHVTKVSEANKEELDIPVSRVKSSKLFEIPLNADSRSYEIKDIMLNNSELLGLDPDIEMCLGAQPYHNSIHTKEQMKSRFLHCDYRKDRDYVQDFSGKHITKYYVTDENNKWVDYSAEFYTKPDSRFFNGPRIVIREIPSETLICGYEDGFKLFNKSVYIIRSKSKDADYLKYILGVLNSKAIGYYITTFGDKSDQKLFPRISMSILKTLPIPKNDTTHQKLIISLVDKIISTKKRDSSADISELEAEIDNVVYMLYGITPEGIGY